MPQGIWKMKTLADKDARDSFSTLVLERPRLMANKAAIERVRKAIDGDDAGQALKAAVMRQADKLDKKPPVEWTSDLLSVSREALLRMQTLGIAWLLEKNDRHKTRAKLELLAICRFKSWISEPPKFLATAEMTHAAAIGYDWFHDDLAPAECKTCFDAILENGLTPGLCELNKPDRDKPTRPGSEEVTGPRWPSRTSNWNIVCNASLMIGALAVGEEKTGLTREIFRRCLDSVPTGFRGYSPDGSWDEGPGYWNYATAYAAYLLSALRTAVGHEFGLGELPGVRNSGYFRMHAEGSAAASSESKAGQLFNYSDGGTTHKGSWCMRWLYLRYGQPEYNRVAINDGRTTPMDLLWYSKETPTKGDPVPRNAVYHGVANVAMMRGKLPSDSAHFRPWEQHHLNEVYVGIRAGANSRDNHHGHLDLGSFVLDADQLRWAIDIPPLEKIPGYADDYDLPDFFDMELDKRFRYYRTGTIGHNTLLIDGENQPLDVQTEIVAFAARLDLVVAVVDLTAAYPKCLRLRRGFALINRRHVLIVDEMTPRDKISVAWQMHTMATATGGTTALLTQGGKKFHARILEPAGTQFQIQKADAKPPEAPNDTKLQKLVATLPAVTGPTRLAVYLSSEREPVALPTPLDAPLWRWIEWAGKQPVGRFRPSLWERFLARLK
jgi:heparinase II/III-like protein